MENERKDPMTIPDGMAFESLPSWLRDLIDINNESAGRETGRIKRFSASSRYEGPESQKREKERKLSNLMYLLQNPHYARLYRQAVDAVDEVDRAAARALFKLERESEVAAQRLRELKEAAAQLPDGRRVFQSKNGRIYTEDSEDVTHLRDAMTGLTDVSPSWEEFQEARDHAKDIERRKQEVETYQLEIINPAKERLADTENPLSTEELEHLGTLKDRAPSDVRAQYDTLENAPIKTNNMPARNSVADELFGSYEPNAPKVQNHFKAASEHEPYGSSATQLPTMAPKIT
ncbi:MAG: hypothetical protein E6Q59_04480 [Nitrosomonas sp.]|nr:hypothetical protein [Nitrosomonas sp.]OQW85475.1 MAG: hypothetical protein BVN30_00785 [Proteobacteria bacterium ST_bin16]TXI39763.1 MAG: hypothetical protein E6Q59_04480 [Nitrosomonas sp.]